MSLYQSLMIVLVIFIDNTDPGRVGHLRAEVTTEFVFHASFSSHVPGRRTSVNRVTNYIIYSSPRS